MRLINTNETMDDLISKQVILDEIDKMPTVTDTNGAKYIEKTWLGIRINMLLPVDAVPVVHSRMIDKGLERQWTVRTHKCKACGGWFAIPFGVPYNYCPGCGAILDEKDGDHHD